MMHESADKYSDYELTLVKTMANNLVHDFARYVAPCANLHSHNCAQCSVRKLCADLKINRLFWNQQLAIRNEQKER